MQTHIFYSIFTLISLIAGTQTVYGAAHDKVIQTSSELCVRGESPFVKYNTQMAYLPETNALVTVSGENNVLYWDADTAAYKGTLPCGTLSSGPQPLNPIHIATSPNNNYIAVSPEIGAVRIFESQVYKGWPQQQQPTQSICHLNFNNELTFNANSRYLISTLPHTSKETLFIHSIRKNLTKKIKAKSLASLCLAAHPIKSSLFASSNGPLIKLYTVKGKKTHAMKTSDRTIASLRYSPDGNELASSSYCDSKIPIWDAQTGQLKNSLTSTDSTIARIAYSPDGRQLASSTCAAGCRGIIHLWDVRSQQISHTLDGKQAGITSLLYNSSGNLVSASSNGTVSIWDSRSIAALSTPVSDKLQEKHATTTACPPCHGIMKCLDVNYERIKKGKYRE